MQEAAHWSGGGGRLPDGLLWALPYLGVRKAPYTLTVHAAWVMPCVPVEMLLALALPLEVAAQVGLMLALCVWVLVQLVPAVMEGVGLLVGFQVGLAVWLRVAVTVPSRHIPQITCIG